MKIPTSLISIAVTATFAPSLFASDPLLDSWFTERSAQYARIYETDGDLAAKNSVTTWSRNTIDQSLPSYAGVQEINFSADWVYIRSTGLGIHTMGPWHLNAARTQLFPNLPYGDATLYRFPRTVNIPANKTVTGLGAIGFFVDGVAMFDIRDGFFWSGSSETGGGGVGYWNRDAVVNEGLTMDPANAHQEQAGTYHYHANPIALRYLLGDNVNFNSDSGYYSESSETSEKHSPIIGWARDGIPMYGPYGYADAGDGTSGIRRMVSGFVLRNGQNGTDNLAVTGRTRIPAWAVRAYGVSASQTGPGVSATYPLGRYIEDHAYRGDLGFTQGVDFDLDEHNGRFCVTPEFPEGVYAYFIAIEANGAPAFPYHIGRTYYGQPTGMAVAEITEAVTTRFLGGPDTPPANRSVSRDENEIVLVWDTVEGGHYRVLASNDLSGWEPVAESFVAGSIQTEFREDAGEAEKGFYRLEFTGDIEPFLGEDSSDGGETGEGPITSVTPNQATRGTTNLLITIKLDADATPPLPPANVVPSSITIGVISGTSLARIDSTTVRASFSFPSDAVTGGQTVTVTFPGPGGQGGPSYSLATGFTVNP